MDYNNNGQNNNSYSSQPQGQYSSQPQGQYTSQPQGQPYTAQPGQPHYSSQNQNAYSGQAPYQGQAYDPNMQYNNPYAQPPVKPGPNACQIISLIVGILSILCCCWGLLGIILGAVGLVLAIIGNKGNKHGVGTGGLVCSIIGLVLSAIILILSIFGTYMIPSSFEDIYETFEQIEEEAR